MFFDQNNKVNEHCFLCNNNATKEEILLPGEKPGYSRYVCKTCSDFIVERSFSLMYENDQNFIENKHILSGISRYRHEHQPFAPLKLDGKYYAYFREHGDPKVPIPKAIDEKLNTILRFIKDKIKYPGEQIKIDKTQDYTIGFTHDKKEFDYYLTHLEKINYIQIIPNTNQSDICDILLTIEGWQYLSKLEEVNIYSNNCFIAMNFDDKYKCLYKNAIEPAVTDAKYKPIHIGEYDKENPDSKITIDNRIVSEIRKARFVVADFTGNKPSVYYESGLARGLGLPVIYCCENEFVKELAFDTNHYPHILWATNDLNAFKESLYYRIMAEIGEGKYQGIDT